MAETKEPTLVKKDGERVAPMAAVAEDKVADAFAKMADVLAAKLGQADARDAQMAQSLAEIRADQQKGDYNIANFPNRSAFNPLGELLHPRGEVKGEVLWAGCPLDEREMTAKEIALANQIVPGIYNGGKWEVINLAPGQPGTRKLLVKFPCKDVDQRAELPSMAAMLQQMIDEANGVSAVPA